MSEPQADGASLAPRDPMEPFAVAATTESAAAPAVEHARPVPKEIATLPTLAEVQQARLPISAATGQPKRAKVMVAANVFLYSASIVSAAALARSWWTAIHVQTFFDSARLVAMWHPRPGGWRSVLAVTLLCLIGAAMVAAPAIAAFNSWNGHRWSRMAAFVAVLVGCLGWLLNPWAWAAPALSLVGAVLLLTPPVRRYFGHWRTFRAGTTVEPREPGPVTYGPLPRYR